VRTLAGHSRKDTVKPSDTVAELIDDAVKHFVAKGELTDGAYALTLPRTGADAELDPTATLHDAGVVEDDVLVRPGEQACRESPYYLDAAATEKRTYSVLADLDLWNAEQLHLPVAEDAPDRRPRAGVTCACGFKGPVTGWPCPDCNKQFCPRCKSCDYDRRAALTERCSECFRSIPRIDLVAGICSGCR
jgi:hypothetical protein